MAIKPVLRMGHPLLREPSKEISIDEIGSPRINQLIADLKDTMKHNQGIGIAAPQIGVNLQICLINLPENPARYPEAKGSNQEYILINPKITILNSELIGCWEGCLSVPNLKGFVQRPKKIKVDFFDRLKSKQSLVIDNFLSIVFQHEIDHLNGVLYIDKVIDTKMIAFCDEYEQFIKN
jgi:peptide deformylase